MDWTLFFWQGLYLQEKVGKVAALMKNVRSPHRKEIHKTNTTTKKFENKFENRFKDHIVATTPRPAS